MILAYVDTIQQDIIDMNNNFHFWKQINTPRYNAQIWSPIYTQTGGTTEYAIIHSDDMVNIAGYDINKVKDISSWDAFNDNIEYL